MNMEPVSLAIVI